MQEVAGLVLVFSQLETESHSGSTVPPPWGLSVQQHGLVCTYDAARMFLTPSARGPVSVSDQVTSLC